jgi:hypothetical protein
MKDSEFCVKLYEIYKFVEKSKIQKLHGIYQNNHKTQTCDTIITNVIIL